MITHSIQLLQKREIADATYAFTFQKPETFSYVAGQYISLCIDPPEIAMPGGTMRELSLASAPYEDELLLALRFRDTPAKQQFLQLEVGNQAFLQGPFGSFLLPSESTDIRDSVFLAGGIGIVPFLGMVKQAVHEKQKRHFYIFISNRRKTDIPFLSELDSIAQKHTNVTLIRTLTGETQTNWEHESGYVTFDMIRKYTLHPLMHSYYISGPQRFVGGMWDLLESGGISETSIHGEEFTGY